MTVGEKFFRECSESKGFRLQDIPSSFSLVSASGATIPYFGCFQTDVSALGQVMESRIVLVIREQCSTLQNWRAANVQGILGMNVLRDCWMMLMDSKGLRHMEKIRWPPEQAWQKALQTVGERMEFGRAAGNVGRAYVVSPEQYIAVCARQAITVECKGQESPSGAAYEAVLEPSKTGSLPSGVFVPPCLVRVESGSFKVRNKVPNGTVRVPIEPGPPGKGPPTLNTVAAWLLKRDSDSFVPYQESRHCLRYICRAIHQGL